MTQSSALDGAPSSAKGDSQASIDLCLASIVFHPSYSGPAIRFRRYEPGFRERGIKMRVVAGTVGTYEVAQDSESIQNQVPVEQNVNGDLPVEIVNGIPIQRLPTPGKSRFKRNLAFLRGLSRHFKPSSGRPDLIQFLTLPLFSLPWLMQLRRRRIPLVFTHTMVGQLSKNVFKRALQRRYWRLPFQLMDCVVVSSRVMEESLRDIGVTTRIDIIPNGVDLHRFHPVESLAAQRELRSKLDLEPEGELVLFVGPLNSRKGVDVLLQAFADLAQIRPQARVVSVGPGVEGSGGTPEQQREFQSRIDKILTDSGIKDRVRFTGATDNVEDYYRAADIFVFPSIREGTPNVVLEAFASGIPVILTPFLGLPEEFGRSGDQYILEERSPKALADAMGALLADKKEILHLSQSGRAWAEEHMGVEKSIEKYAELYRQLAHGNRNLGDNR